MRSQTTRTIAGAVNADGSISIPGGFTCQKSGTATYILTFPPGFRLTGIAASADSTGSAVAAMATARTATSATIITRLATTGAGADSTFAFVATGVGA